MEKLIPQGVLNFFWDMSKSWALDKGEDAHIIYGRMVAHHVHRALTTAAEEAVDTE